MKKILFVTDPIKLTYYDIIKDHIAKYYADKIDATYNSLDELIGSNNFSLFPPREFDLVVYWLQDPLHNRPDMFNKALLVSMDFDNVPCINDPNYLGNTTKSVAAKYIGLADFFVPEMIPFARHTKAESLLKRPGFDLPFFIRENDQHGRHMFLIRKSEDLQDVSIKYGIEETIMNPVMVEYIDTAINNRYWKYRCMVIGDTCIPFHVQSSHDWIVRGENRVKDDIEYDVEKHYCSGNVLEGQRFIKAARLLNFDTCAFDYAFTPEGEIIVWEVNVFPLIHYLKTAKDKRQQLMNDQTKRVMDELVEFYMRKAI